MENIFVEFLPPWVETGLQPAFYDKESGTVLQQTARMYTRVNMLIRMFNKLSKNTKEEVERFEGTVNDEIERFEGTVNDTVEEYIEKFNDLHNYVHDYFDNLDVQEEINIKLDQMAEDGTLTELMAIYLRTAIWCFDNVSDMLSSPNLADGSFAETLGYYNKNDGGGSIYKIVADNTLVDDGGSVIAFADSDLRAVLINSNIINVGQFGIDATHNTNWQNLISFVNNNRISLIQFNPITYTLNETLTITQSNLTIDGNGSKFNYTDDVKDITIFNITGDNITLKNINIYGDEDAQDQWSVTNHSELILRRSFNITAPKVSIDNVNIYNVWGEGIKLYNYNDVSINNCEFNKIGGGFYITDAQGYNDYFGDALYLGGFNGNAIVSINNVKCVGYVNTNGKGSRGGLVMEDLSGGTYSKTSAFITISNSEFTDFNRFLHHENYGCKTNIEVNNCNIKQNASICTSSVQPKLVINDSYIEHTSADYNGTRGFRGFNFIINNSEIYVNTGASASICQGADTIGKYYNTKIDHVNGLVINGGNSLYFENCDITVQNDSSYLAYGVNPICVKCIFRNSASNLKVINHDNGNPFTCEDCTFYNIYPNSRSPKIGNTLYSTSDTPNNTQLRQPEYFGMFDVYVSDSLVARPSICGIIDADNVTNTANNMTQVLFSNSVTQVPIIPTNMPATFIPNLNSKYLLIIRGSNDHTNRFNSNWVDCYYTVLSYDKNKKPSISTITTIGNPGGAGNALSFDTDNNTIEKASQHSQSVNRVIYWIIPYEKGFNIGSFNLT